MKLDDEYAGVPLYLWIAGGGLLAAGAWWYVRRYRAAKAENATTQNLTDGVDRALRNVAASPTTSGSYYAGGGGAALPQGAADPAPVPTGAQPPGMENVPIPADAAGPAQPGSTPTNASYVPGSVLMRSNTKGVSAGMRSIDGSIIPDFLEMWNMPDASGKVTIPVGWSKV